MKFNLNDILRNRLGKKFFRFFLVVGVLPLILMGAISIYVVNLTNRISIASLEQTLLKQKATETEKTIRDASNLIELQVAISGTTIDVSSQKFLLNGMLMSNPDLESITLISKRTGLAPNEVNNWQDGEEQGRAECATRDPKTNACTGTNVITFPSPELTSKLDDPAYRIPANTKQDYFGNVTYATSGPTMTISAPILNDRTELIGVLEAELNLNPLLSSLRKTALGNDGYIYIVDTSGKIIAHSRDAAVIGQPVSEIRIVNDILSNRIVNGLGKDSMYQSIWSERELNISGKSNRPIVIAASTLVPTTNWGIIAEWPRDDAEAVLWKIINQIVIFSVLTLILILIVSTIVALQLLKPIRAIETGATEIGLGNLAYRIKVQPGDELGELGHKLNKMAEQLKGLEEVQALKYKTKFLSESLKKEKELSTLKDQFISVGSHQLYTPLSVINWTLEMLRQPDIPKETLLEGLKNIDQSRRDILAIATDLLTLSEIGFKYKKTKSEMIDLAKIIEDTIGKYKAQAKEKDLEIIFDNKAADSKIDANQFAMEKVFEALLENAIIYSDDNTKVQLELNGDDKEIRFSIKNNGVGIPENEKQYIFQQFFRAKNAVAKKNVGTGLGLYIVKSIVEGHGGKVEFESEENKGATFFLSLPRQAAPDVPINESQVNKA